MSILEKLKKNSTVKEADILSESKFFTKKDMIQTAIPSLNIALSGRLDGGLTPGLTQIVGPSKHGKSTVSLVIAKAYLDKYPESIMLFYDSEFGSPQSYFSSLGIDLNRVLHTPIVNMEQLKHDIMTQLNGMDRGDRIVIIIDSIGNLASKKEIDDAVEGKSVADMSRAKQLKSIFRMVTPHLTMKDIPMIVINHSYKEIGSMYPKDIVSGGCLAAGTKIKTEYGLKNIEDISVGENVETMFGLKEVTAIWNPTTLENGTPECFSVEFEDGYEVTCSDNHKFLVDGKWVEAKYLTDETEVSMLENAIMKIKSIKKLGTIPVFDISVKDAEHYVLENNVITHNTGSYYSSDTIFIMGRQQEKSGTDIVGYNFVINVEKSRYVKEKSKIPIALSFDGGISKWSGLLDIALESGFVEKPANGWYTRPKFDTTGKKYRADDTDTKEFWIPVLKDTEFQTWVQKRYQISAPSSMVQYELEDRDLEEVFSSE